ncbi:hypothetical protein K4L06_17340 [Lysobacter sp. BMK333-48F3]|uniref:hypothetical protein n=1 Tax=Lysobacter sp. BMK333-48F3 TaxID=2867962 RepID=UPI001C8B1A2C|nr:hypothetical protein [Lysobacter sp. BMK333-48F3]MBX9403076.1 hypothetical protein [Lysobacter sp. BMK333-48F3]
MSAPVGPRRAADAVADGFLGRLVARARHEAPLLSRRRPSLFEPRPGSSAASESIETIATEAPAAVPARNEPTRREDAAPASRATAAATAIAGESQTPALAAPSWPAPVFASTPASPAFATAVRNAPPIGEHAAIQALERGIGAVEAGPATTALPAPAWQSPGAPLPERRDPAIRHERIERVERSERIERIERAARIEQVPQTIQTGAAPASLATLRAAAHGDGVLRESTAAPAALALPPRLPAARAPAPTQPTVASPGRAAAMAPAAAIPAPVQVSIGRLEVRAVAAAPIATAPKPGAREPRLALEDYLRQRHGGRS